VTSAAAVRNAAITTGHDCEVVVGCRLVAAAGCRVGSITQLVRGVGVIEMRCSLVGGVWFPERCPAVRLVPEDPCCVSGMPFSASWGCGAGLDEPGEGFLSSWAPGGWRGVTGDGGRSRGRWR